MTTLLMHEARQQAEQLRHRLAAAIAVLPPDDARQLLGRLTKGEQHVPTLVFSGQHSGGKSMLIKALTNGAAEVVIDADIATDSVARYDWDGLVSLVDTPGVGAGLETHDEMALEAVKGADLVLFVITPDLFDDASAQLLKYIVEVLGKGSQLMVVVNKAQTMGADPGVRQRALQLVLGDTRLPPLVECDAKNYVLSLTESDPETADLLRMTSGIEALRNEINRFSRERGDLATLRQPLQLIRSIAGEAEASLVDDPQEKALFTWLARVRRTLSQHEQSLHADIDAERARFLRDALVEAEEFADSVEALDNVSARDWQHRFDVVSADYVERLNRKAEASALRMEQVVESVLHGLASEMQEVDQGPQADLIRAFVDGGAQNGEAREGPWHLRARRGAPPPNRNTSRHMAEAQQLLARFKDFWGAGDGVKASAGSAGHIITKQVGSFFGKSWRPWEAVRWANRIGKAVRVAGVALQIGLTAYEVYAQEQRDVRIERARAARRRAIVNQVMGEAENKMDDVIRSIRAIVDVPFQKAYNEIDEERASLLRDQETRRGIREELDLIQEDCSQMLARLAGSAGRGDGLSENQLAVP